jgi:hypothetical protein
MLENTEGIVENGKSRATGKIGHKTQNEDKQNNNTTQNTMCSLTTKYDRSRRQSTHHQCLDNY